MDIASILMGADAALSILGSLSGKTSTSKDRFTNEISNQLTTMTNRVTSAVNAFDKSLQRAYMQVNNDKNTDMAKFDAMSIKQKTEYINQLSDIEKRKLDAAVATLDKSLSDVMTKYNSIANKVNNDYNQNVLPNVTSYTEFAYNNKIKQQMEQATTELDKLKDKAANDTQDKKNLLESDSNKRINQLSAEADAKTAEKRAELEEFHNKKIDKLNQYDKHAVTIASKALDSQNGAINRLQQWDSHKLSYMEGYNLGLSEGAFSASGLGAFNIFGGQGWGEKYGDSHQFTPGKWNQNIAKEHIFGYADNNTNAAIKDLSAMIKENDNIGGSWFDRNKEK